MQLFGRNALFNAFRGRIALPTACQSLFRQRNPRSPLFVWEAIEVKNVTRMFNKLPPCLFAIRLNTRNNKLERPRAVNRISLGIPKQLLQREMVIVFKEYYFSVRSFRVKFGLKNWNFSSKLALKKGIFLNIYFWGVEWECEIRFWRSASENRFFGIIKNIRKMRISCSITNLS